jgi:hypothetical protein
MVIQETPTTLEQMQAQQVESSQRVRGGMRFDWAFTLACCWLIGGLHLDGWARLRIFAFAVPAILYGLYFIAMIVNDGGIGWSVHLWAGSAVMAGIVGVLLSYLVVLPQLARDEATPGATRG